MPLDREEAEKILKSDTERSQADEIMDYIFKDPEVVKVIKRKVEAMNKKKLEK